MGALPERPYHILPSGGSVKLRPGGPKGRRAKKEIDTRRGGAAPGGETEAHGKGQNPAMRTKSRSSVG